MRMTSVFSTTVFSVHKVAGKIHKHTNNLVLRMFYLTIHKSHSRDQWWLELLNPAKCKWTPNKKALYCRTEDVLWENHISKHQLILHICKAKYFPMRYWSSSQNFMLLYHEILFLSMKQCSENFAYTNRGIYLNCNQIIYSIVFKSC